MDTQYPRQSDHDKSQLVHDALAECKDSNKLYLLIHEHFESAKSETGAERDSTFKLIGSIVFHAISDYEKGEPS